MNTDKREASGAETFHAEGRRAQGGGGGWRLAVRRLAAGACLLAGAACSLPQAQPDPTRFYVLSTGAAAAPAASEAPTLHLRPIELAGYLRGRPIVVRRSENEVDFREFARWGEPLETGIARVLREELVARGAVRAVLATGARAALDEKDRAVSVRVLACEGAARGAVVFRAVWEISKGGANGPVAAGDYHPTDLRWDGKNEATLAAGLSRAVAGLADEISAALRK